MPIRFVCCILAVVAAATLRAADGDPELPRFAEPKKDWAWDEDKRFDFLMERLANLEASLDAVEAAIAKATGKKNARSGEARVAEKNNTLMDRKAGGPMRWAEFYGTNAEKFFYHPVDPNTTYHTDTFLRQMGSAQDDKVGAGVPATQSLPVHQRPPQFDYIYRANRDAKERAEKEALALQGKVDELNSRRVALEQEQAELWCKLAFRAIQRLNIPRKPLLRFQLVPASTSEADRQKADALAAAAKFLGTALLIIDKAEEDQAAAFANVKNIVGDGRNEFDDALLNADAVAESVPDKKTPLGKYVALAQLLDDTSSNLSESYEVAMEGDQAQDRVRKDRFRGLLQQSLIEYAQIVMALDELTSVMKTDWKVAVDTKTRVSQDRQPRDWKGRPPSDERNTSGNGDAVGLLVVPPGGSDGSAGGAGAQANGVAAGNVDEAIDRGLRWLISHQMADGSWSFDHGACPGCNGQCGNSGQGSQAQDRAAATALSLLAFYRHGDSHKQGPHKDKLLKGIAFLVGLSTSGNGKCYGQGGNMYSQGCAGIALAESYRLTKDSRIKPAAQAALNFIQESQDPEGGGWRYSPKQKGDTSATGWQVAALAAGKSAGLGVNPATLVKVNGFLNSTQSNGGASYGYTDPGNALGTTAVGLYCRALMGWRANDPPMQQGLSRLVTTGPSKDLYFNYYATQAARLAGGDPWNAWKGPMREKLLKAQASAGHAAGSWYEGVDGGHGAHAAGRVYCTSLATMILAADSR
jgi:hypothetical protein